MKYSVSVRQPAATIEQADEIRVDYRDVNILYDKVEEFPAHHYCVIIPRGADVNWEELKTFAARVKMIIGVEDLAMFNDCRKAGLAFFWVYPVTTYYEYRSLIESGISAVVLGAPLYFDLKGVKLVKEEVKIRLAANLCYDGRLGHTNGIYGTYIRPEDVYAYDPYVDTIFFESDSLSQENSLLAIYKTGRWDGNLNLLLKNFNFDVDNRAIPDEFGKARTQCRQDCMRHGGCHFCETSVKFSRTLDANKDRWKTGTRT